MIKNIWKIALLLVLVLLTAVLIPSATLVAGAEEGDCPIYEPVVFDPVEPLDFSNGTPYLPHESGYLPDGAGYRDETINVEIHMMRRHATNIMVAFVQIADASQMRTELCKPYPSTAVAPAASLAKRVNAVFATSGDSFNDTKVHTGHIVRNGETLRTKYDEKYDMLVIDEKGDFHIITPMLEETLAAYEGEIIQSFAFGPALVVDGAANYDYRLKTNVPTHETQRLAIGQIGPLTYVLVATEGPENKGSHGLTMTEMTDLMIDLGAINAYNLDGGSSSTLVMNGRKINSLSSGKVRPIGDIIYFVTAVPEEN